MNHNYYCVIMAGGYANHFWPLSRESRPKQFLNIAGRGHSFVRDAYERCLGLVPQENILIITLSRYKDLVREQIPELPAENLLLEPYGRKTAPCIAYATYTLLGRNPEAVVAVTPADLLIPDEGLFRETLSRALDYAARNEVLATLGIVPSRPDTNYGYIQAVGGALARNDDKPVKVKTFTEKPDAALAQVFYQSGEFFWNSGIFVWQARVIEEEMRKYTPEITTLFQGWESALGSPAEEVFLERAYTDCTKLSIDYGVMEKTDRAWLFPVRFEWSDIDNWESLYNSEAKDGDGNLCLSPNNYLKDSSGNILLAQNAKKLIAVDGLKDYVVIDTPDVLLVCPRDSEQYRDFISGLSLPGFDEYK